MTPEKREKINTIMQVAIFRAFEQIEDRGLDTPPSEVELQLESNWGLGDYYKEWWLEGGDDWY